MTIDQFYRDILYPVEQPLGRSRDYPFQKLMEEIDSGPLSSKLIMATLNAYQYQEKDRYWHHELKAHNFKLIAKTSNSIGTINYVYMRNPNEVEIEDAEA